MGEKSVECECMYPDQGGLCDSIKRMLKIEPSEDDLPNPIEEDDLVNVENEDVETAKNIESVEYRNVVNFIVGEIVDDIVTVAVDNTVEVDVECRGCRKVDSRCLTHAVDLICRKLKTKVWKQNKQGLYRNVYRLTENPICPVPS